MCEYFEFVMMMMMILFGVLNENDMHFQSNLVAILPILGNAMLPYAEYIIGFDKHFAYLFVCS